MKFENYMTLEFPSRSANEGFARSAVACFAAQMDPTLEELGDIRTAVSEAVTNCIVHAYPEAIGLIAIRCRILKDNVLDIVIKDKGIGIVNLEEARKPMYTTSPCKAIPLMFPPTTPDSGWLTTGPVMQPLPIPSAARQPATSSAPSATIW